MKTIIIPVDFSDGSLNAARYAANMFSGFTNIRIILYHMYNDMKEEEVSGNYLESLQMELAEKGDKEIELQKDFGHHLSENLGTLAQQKAASLIVMGTTGHGKLSRAVVGSNTLKMIEKNICPVLIVPPNASFTEIKNVAYTADFKNIDGNTPVIFIKNILDEFKPSLHIVNVDSGHYVALTEEYQQGKQKILSFFEDYNPEFYFIGTYNFVDTVNQFVGDRNIDLIVTVPRHHSFLNNHLKSSHTKELMYHSTVPILAAHE